jgi:pimeloyl-ACP methyl ester carboxylesterase
MRALVPVIIVFSFVLLHSCMTFRSTPSELKEFFDKENVKASIKHLEIDKRTMEYVQTGDSTKPLILFVHGSPGSLNAFVSYLADSTLLTEAFLISADRPGFGNSNFGYAEPSLKKQGDILMRIVQRHKSSKPVILVGHSLGGPLIAKMAIDYPNLIDGLVIIAGSIDPDLEPNEMWFRAPLSTPFLRWVLPRSFRASNDELYKLKPQLLEMLPDWQKISCPVMVIHGRKDELVPYANVDFARTHLVNAQVQYLTFDDAGHFIPWQKEKEIIDAILSLLATAKEKQKI